MVPFLPAGFHGEGSIGLHRGAEEKAARVPAQQLAAQARLPAHSAKPHADSLHSIHFYPAKCH